MKRKKSLQKTLDRNVWRDEKMNAIGTYRASAGKSGGVGFMRKTEQKENKISGQIIGFLNLNQGINEEESKEKKSPGLGVVKAGGEFIPETEESIRKSEQEQVLFAERVQSRTLKESDEDKAIKARKWEYVRQFPTLAWSEADKKRIFNNQQICLDGDGSDMLTEEQLALLKDKYDVRHLTAEDAYYLMCDLTKMNVFSSEEWTSMIIDGIQLSLDDIDALSGRIKDEGTWGWMWDEESGCNILVYSRSFYQEEEDEDPESIKARIKGQLDDVLLAAFGSKNKGETVSPEEFQSGQILKEDAEGIAGELEAKLMSGRKITELEMYNGGANSGVLLDIAVRRWNMAAEIKGLTQAAPQIPDTAARLLPQYQKKFDASDKFLRIVDQIKR